MISQIKEKKCLVNVAVEHCSIVFFFFLKNEPVRKLCIHSLYIPTILSFTFTTKKIFFLQFIQNKIEYQNDSNYT